MWTVSVAPSSWKTGASGPGSRRSPRSWFPAFPALPRSQHPPRIPRASIPSILRARHSPCSPFPALNAAIALRAACPARETTVSATAALAPGPARAAALLGCAPRPRVPYAADWRPLQPALQFPQCGAAARSDWPQAAKARPPLARAAGGSRRPGRAWAAFLDGGGGRAVRVSLLWLGCGQLGQAAGAGGKCGAQGAPRRLGGRALRPSRGRALPFPG